MTNIPEDLNPNDFYFWLGEGAESVSKNEFVKKMSGYKRIIDDYYECPHPTEPQPTD